VVQRAMALACDDRWPSAEAMAAALGREEAPAARPGQPSWWQQVPVWGWALGALVAVVLLGVGLSALAGNGDETPTLAAGDPRTRETDGMTMVYVPAGEFEMGSTEGDEDAEPVHTVALDAFWLDQTEVSVAQFRQFVAAADHETTAEESGSSWAYTDDGWEWVEGADWAHPQGPASQAEDDHPVVHISWHDADAYCAWAGGRLPTEAEWEYAARGPESLIYPWGNIFDGTRLNYCDQNCPRRDRADEDVDDGYEFTAPVGSYPGGASWIGALDLSGNVWEWTADWYAEDYYAQSPRENPTGPEEGEYRVLRGGDWWNSADGSRCGYRVWYFPWDWGLYRGFRCVRTSPPVP
jgi:eukaryotic-like serine/threonine-protein kinase